MELQQSYQPDFVCFDNILIELKAVDHLIPRHESQLLNYLHASGLELGILINFGSHPKLEQKRIVLTKSHAKE